MHSSTRRQKHAALAGTAFLIFSGTCFAETKQLQPGFNLFTPRQDVELGKEAGAELERQLPMLRNAEVDRYLSVLLRKLEQSRYARSLESDGARAEMFPFQIRAVA